jgi:uncharacterized protein (TIGR03790 family)
MIVQMTMTLLTRLAGVAALSAVMVPGTAFGQTGRNVLVVANAASPGSVRIAEHYAGKRGVPADQVLKLSALPAEPADGIDRATFERAIQVPVANWLLQRQATDRILFIVLTKGIPLRINGGDKRGDAASVDSELAVLYLRMTGAEVPIDGPFPNPYFLGNGPISKARRFRRADQEIFLVTRLDGYTVDDVIALIDRGAAPTSTGRFVLDAKASLRDNGNDWLRDAAARLRAAGLSADRVVLDEGAGVLTNLKDVLGYYSWGSNDPAIRQRTFDLEFRPGAIAGMFVSTDGRTFAEPPASWSVGEWTDKRRWHEGSPQSLAGDLIRAGVTGVSGHVAEPLLGNTIRPNILFPAYVAGFTLAEAYYLAMPSLSWMTVVVGDPLCAPFASGAETAEDPPVDPQTELPSVFSARRLTRTASTAATSELQKLMLRAESRQARNDLAGARADFQRATELAPTAAEPRLRLAAMAEADERFDEAIDHYRRVLAINPDSPVVLNNLGYLLATRKAAVGEGLELAERARSLAPRSGSIADTVGWIYFMQGDFARARQLLTEAVRLSPRVATIRLHLVEVLLSAGDHASAERELKALMEAIPDARNDPEYQRLLARVATAPKK